MSITDELRERIDVESLPLSTRRELWNIADRIDAEHESKVSYWQGASYKDGYDEGFASADDWLAQHEDAMAEHGWVKLPVDADGELIHVGDRINVYQAKNVEVVGVGDRVVFTHYYMGDYHKHFAGDCHHHHTPTVEDVLREFFSRYVTTKPKDEDDAIIAEYAAKLRLAGEDE